MKGSKKCGGIHRGHAWRRSGSRKQGEALWAGEEKFQEVRHAYLTPGGALSGGLGLGGSGEVAKEKREKRERSRKKERSDEGTCERRGGREKE